MAIHDLPLVNRLLAAGPRGARPPSDGGVAEWLEACEDLAQPAGGAALISRAAGLLRRYEEASPAQREALLKGLAERFRPDEARLARALEAYRHGADATAVAELHAATEAPRQQVIRNLNLAPDGTARLVRMRADLQALRPTPAWAAALDADFSHVLSSWFNPGFLRLERIDWSSPASLLRKIIAYEAVHEIADWEELRRRLEPPDRRCYAFFHARLPDEPLIFVEVALTPAVPSAMTQLLQADRTPIAAGAARVATFYSISNCQPGLRGIPFGSFLIDRVVAALQGELPRLRTFVTLSPIPGLRAWAEAAQDARGAGQAADGEGPRPEALRRLAAAYLLQARTADGLPRDPVARFHLGNGASVLAVHAGADPSPKGLAQSYGAMVNYRYDLRALARNQARLASQGLVTAAVGVRRLAGRGR